MAGHSKFKNIMHRKGAQDKKRAKIFGRLIKELTVAARSSTDPDSNPRLRTALSAARAANMPKDNIERVLRRAEGGEGENYDEIRYEGYGPGGVAVLVEVMTDNKNRTVAEVRHAFSKCGGNLGTDGSVAYLFTKRGQILIENADEDVVMEAALEAGAEDVIGQVDALIDVATTQNDVIEVKDALVAAGIEVLSAEVALVPSTIAELDLDIASKMIKLIDMLEDLDDVQNVYTNANFTDELLESLV